MSWSKVFPLPPLSLCVLLCLLSPVLCLHDGRTARRLDFSTSAFLPSSSDLTHFPLSGFFHPESNQVDTLFSVPGLDTLPPIHQDNQSPPTAPAVPSLPRASPESAQHPQPPPSPRSRPVNQQPTFTPTTFPNIQIPGNSKPNNIGDIFSNFRPSGGFPTLFNPFKNFFHFSSFPRTRQTRLEPALVTPSSVFTVITTPLTTPRIATKRSTTKRSTTRRSTIQRSTTKRSTTHRSTTHRTTTQRSTTQRLKTQRSTTQRSTTQRSTTQRSTTQRSTTQRSTSTTKTTSTTARFIPEEPRFFTDSVHFYDNNYEYEVYDDSSEVYNVNKFDYDDTSDYYDEYQTTQEDSYYSPSCPGSLRECLTACSPIIRISQVAYKLCVNECLDRCQ